MLYSRVLELTSFNYEPSVWIWSQIFFLSLSMLPNSEILTSMFVLSFVEIFIVDFSWNFFLVCRNSHAFTFAFGFLLGDSHLTSKKYQKTLLIKKIGCLDLPRETFGF